MGDRETGDFLLTDAEISALVRRLTKHDDDGVKIIAGRVQPYVNEFLLMRNDAFVGFLIANQDMIYKNELTLKEIKKQISDGTLRNESILKETKQVGEMIIQTKTELPPQMAGTCGEILQGLRDTAKAEADAAIIKVMANDVVGDAIAKVAKDKSQIGKMQYILVAVLSAGSVLIVNNYWLIHQHNKISTTQEKWHWREGYNEGEKKGLATSIVDKENEIKENLKIKWVQENDEKEKLLGERETALVNDEHNLELEKQDFAKQKENWLVFKIVLIILFSGVAAWYFWKFVGFRLWSWWRRRR